MTVTDNSRRAIVYGAIADKAERDPVQGGEGTNRATVPMGRGFRTWQRFHPDTPCVSVIDDGGREWFLTPKQAKVYDLARTYFDNGATRIRHMAAELRFSPSTVSRALVKLAAIGLIGYIVGRGRYGAVLLFARSGRDDGLEAFRTRAKAKIRAWSQAAERRVLRLKINVATYFSYEEVRSHGYEHVYGDVMNATLKREWRDDELVDIV